MAVQAAIMNSQFLNFCFPGSGMEFGAERCLDGGLLCASERDEGGIAREATRDLLSFIDSASSNIKLALDKPVKSKRKVNHRKYLQKQIKRCTGIIAPSTSPPTHSPTQAPAAAGASPARELPLGQGSPPAPAVQHQPLQLQPGAPQAGSLPGRTPPKRDEVLANLQSKSLAALFSSAAKESRGERAKKPPLRHRNLPPSFFTEPANYPRGAPTMAPGLALKETERANPEPSDFFELLGPDYNTMLLDQELFQTAPGPLLPRALQDVPLPGLVPTPVTYEPPHYVTSGFVYAEPWTACVGPPKKGGGGGEGVRTGQGTLYSPTEVSGGVGMEDGFSPVAFYADCPSTPQGSFDGELTGAYAQGSFSSL